MKGYLNTQRKADCFGCGSCFQACPQCAISMEADAEGFEYPKVITHAALVAIYAINHVLQNSPSQ